MMENYFQLGFTEISQQQPELQASESGQQAKKPIQSGAATTFFDIIFQSDFECQLATAGKRFFWSHKKQSWLVHWSKQPLVRVPALTLQLSSRDASIL